LDLREYCKKVRRNGPSPYRLSPRFAFPVDNPPPFNLNEHGYYDWKATVAGKTMVKRVTVEDLREFASWDTSLVWKYFPSDTDVLTIHGMADKVVPPSVLFHSLPGPFVLSRYRYDATIYARALGARSPGTHNLYFVEYADHNFTKVRT